MNKALLALSITILSGSLLAQESPITPRAKRVQISKGPEVPLVGGYFDGYPMDGKQSRWFARAL
jgi:hypothetical protein